ncbi:hypothetical protein K461DRAFT_291961 [Myriangium duriaei CBS 260.36]|uniref:Ribosomal protein S17 n=1 Tax=Myriangium duriaei CBS 260.36 TaxID=1168546 RepID=A0A9P4J4T3_9PEZI|nr:hypothetical protein K461DRAFT_291961 [Myriangium duriaei CBS 260.36]
MASIVPRPARQLCSALRSQYPRPAILPWRVPQRAASTTIGTPVTTVSDIPPQTAKPTTTAKAPQSIQANTTQKSKSNPNKYKKPGSNKRIVARVAKAGYMDKTVRVEMATHVWDNYLRKFYRSSQHMLVHDPANSLREGDMIHVRRLDSIRTHQVHHVVDEVLVPYGTDIADRPPVPSEEELRKVHEAATGEKVERRALRQKAATGDEEAAKKVGELGIGIKEAVSGKGRSRRVRIVLERDLVKGRK